MSDNVIPFPKGKRGAPPQSLDETIAEVNFARQEKVDIILSEMIPFIMSMLYDAGIDALQQKCAKDNAMLFESFKALLYKAYDQHHPLHQLSESIFEVDTVGEEGFEYKYDFTKYEEETSS